MILKPEPVPVPVSKPTPERFGAATLVAAIRQALLDLPDARRGGNNQRYTMGDAGLSAFSVFFMQSPSFLDFQARMQKERGRNNASALFGVHAIPCPQQICNLLAPVAPEQLAPVFMDLVGALVAGGELAAHRALDEHLLVALDGTEHHCSEAIHCPQCSTRTLANGKTQYSHTAVTPVIVAPGQAAVLPLAPAFVAPQDGQAKQDGELNAGTRWLHRRGARAGPASSASPTPSVGSTTCRCAMARTPCTSAGAS